MVDLIVKVVRVALKGMALGVKMMLQTTRQRPVLAARALPSRASIVTSLSRLQSSCLLQPVHAKLAHSESSREQGHGRGRGRWRDDRRPPPRLLRTNDGTDVPQLTGEGVYGLHSVRQALESGHRHVHALYVREEVERQRPLKKSTSDVRALCRVKELAQDNGVPIHTTSKWMLNHMTGDKPHQGVVLDAAPLQLNEFVPAKPSELDESKRSPVILALDEIHDPQNFGAILRSAHFLGCAAVIVSDRNSAPLSPAVSRASVGALEVLVANDKLLKVQNLHETLAISGDFGWRIIGASSGPNSIISTRLSSDESQPTILVMGNEHHGLRKSIRQCCQDIVIIPGQAVENDTRVDSLNVSVASAILLYELLHH
uniref:rRNA methyltransferase 1, mitochondrial n=1 Tax=Hyaloperonospora arabidopsidis (strain Emoy2) TaxID=559515 RepID=M4BVT8_HYAAE|nr:RxLR effector candidate protein [Hyaloperonospora arabidopsidis Emoy2]